MNLPQPITNSDSPALQDGEEVNLLDLFDVVVESRWLIIFVTFVCLLVGGIYAFVSTPTFEANTLSKMATRQ